MASLRRLSDGATPLRQQRQITSFFSPGKPSNQASANSPASNSLFPSKRNSNSSPSPQSNQKPRLTIGPLPVLDSNLDPDAGNSPVPRKSLYGEEVVGKKIRVFWPLDDDWYEGCVKSFDKVTGKHLILYEDAEEEDLDLGIEKFEWIECFPRSFRRLRRNSDCSARNGAVTSSEVRLTESVKAGDVSECALEKESSDVKSGDNDDSTDEDWGKSMGKEMIDDDSEDVALESDGELENLNEGFSKNCGRGKRKKCEGKMSGSANAGKRKSRIAENGGMGALGVSPSGGRSGGIEPSNGAERVLEPCAVETFLTGDAPERFGRRETEKFGFLGKGRKDADGRSPGDVNYNARTLYLPPSFLKSLTGGQRQWWEFKSKHMDKVLFFKMGKFYELFEMDAHVGAKELDLQYMKGEQPHCGFPEKNFSMNVEKLARKGYRVLVVEQTETPEQLELRRKEMGSKDKVVKREICAVVTKGTLTEGEMLATSPDSTYLMSVTEGFQVSGSKEDNDVIVGICVVDVSTSRFMLGQFRDDPERHQLCSILAELRPVELIKPAKKLNPETEKVLLRHTRNPLVNELIPFLEFWDAERTLFEIRNLYGHFKDQPLSRSLNDSKNVSISASPDIIGNVSGSLPDVLSTLASSGENGQYALSALGGCLFYLRQTFLDEALLRFAKFDLLPSLGYLNTPEKPYMTLDAAALENLEIFENNKNGGTSGTLFAQLDHCVTAFGKRLLKNWLARPLYHVASIIERQDAVADLKGVASASALEFRKELSRLPDMERLLSRLFAGSEANGRNANKVVLYEDAAKKQLQEFIAALRGCQQMEQACSTFSAILNITESSLLHHILTPGKGLPDIHLVLKHFKDGFDWSEADRTGRVIPCGGVDVEYDSACRTYVEIETSLATHLKEQRKVLGDASINYVTVGKEQYLLEVPENLQGTVPGDYELRSSRKGYFRYWTPKIKLFLQQLSQAEAEKESKLKSIQQRLIGSFCVHHVKWRQLVSATAELDVLISLAATSNYHEGPTCRPAILGISSSNEGANSPCLSAKCLGHPILRSDALGKGSFVPNDVDIGGVGRPCFILLTGPNMGGKSTLLRQICMAVILAQIGADVPAESFLLSPVDRIFVRMGARDHIMAGQSTFLTELSETGTMLSSATHNSLVVLDELGRGTSTSDGQAIAESVLEHFVRKIRCRGMFSTHYHRLAVNYENDPMVSLCHMACQVGQGARDVEEVTFLYRLTPGICPKSYGVNVARLAGIPDPVLRRAAAKSTQFESIYGKHMHGMDVDSSDNCADEEIAAIQEILCIGLSSNSHEISKNMDMSQLCKLQERASLLM